MQPRRCAAQDCRPIPNPSSGPLPHGRGATTLKSAPFTLLERGHIIPKGVGRVAEIVAARSDRIGAPASGGSSRMRDEWELLADALPAAAGRSGAANTRTHRGQALCGIAGAEPRHAEALGAWEHAASARGGAR